jgi:hypothetical protein
VIPALLIGMALLFVLGLGFVLGTAFGIREERADQAERAYIARKPNIHVNVDENAAMTTTISTGSPSWRTDVQR